MHMLNYINVLNYTHVKLYKCQIILVKNRNVKLYTC
jgi:hypothetical protein